MYAEQGPGTLGPMVALRLYAEQGPRLLEPMVTGCPWRRPRPTCYWQLAAQLSSRCCLLKAGCTGVHGPRHVRLRTPTALWAQRHHDSLPADTQPPPQLGGRSPASGSFFSNLACSCSIGGQGAHTALPTPARGHPGLPSCSTAATPFQDSSRHEPVAQELVALREPVNAPLSVSRAHHLCAGCLSCGGALMRTQEWHTAKAAQ